MVTEKTDRVKRHDARPGCLRLVLHNNDEDNEASGGTHPVNASKNMRDSNDRARQEAQYEKRQGASR